ncbi:hypothetical protein BDV18DRAFT_158753 [Aspergillus unguis]
MHQSATYQILEIEHQFHYHEKLPIELRIEIIACLPDLKSLRSIALSSISLYQAYTLARREAHTNILRTQFDGIVQVQDAIAAVRSKPLHVSEASNRDKIIALLDDRRRSEEIRRLRTQTRSKLPLPDDPTNEQEIRDLLELHEEANWLLDDYCRNAPCPWWTDSDTWNKKVLPLELSNIEKGRWYRAFYRLQTYCNIFGQGEIALDSKKTGKAMFYWNKNFTNEEVWRLFFGPFAPWEYEEFKCLAKYVFDRNGQLYQQISDDLEKYGHEMPRLPDRLRATVLPSCALLETDDLRMNAWDNREVLASFGPSFLVRFLKAAFITQRDMVYANSHRGLSWLPDGPLRIDFSDKYPLLYPADRFNFGTNWEGLKALVLTLPEIDRPSLGWQQNYYQLTDGSEPTDEVFSDYFETDGGHIRRLTWQMCLWDDERSAKWQTEYGAPVKDHGI